MKIQLQTESSECGLACLAMIAGVYGYNIDLPELRRKFSISLKGATLSQLMRHASAMQLSTRPLRVEIDELACLKLPCILHWDLNHFVVLKKINNKWNAEKILIVIDPAVGERHISVDEISNHFTGVVLELSPSEFFKKKKEPRTIAIRDLIGPIVGLRSAIIKTIILAFSLEVFVIASPLFNQFVVDEVIASGDKELLAVLAVGFSLLMATQTLIGLARSWFLMCWSMEISYQWSARVFSHLTRLPVSFFEKRHLGDIVSRFNSIGIIQGTLTNLFVESALDCLMAILAFGMMLLYSMKLSAIVAVAVLFYALLRWLFYQPFREATQERLVLSAKESSHFFETLRAISPLKLFAREEQRQARWLNLKMDVQNRDVKTQKIAILFRLANTALFSLQALVVFYIGAGQVMQNIITLGMLMAFSSYAGTFSGRVFSLIDIFIDVKVLGLHCERLADIVQEESEVIPAQERDISNLETTITLKNVKFRYAEGEPFVLNDISLVIPAGQKVALIGPSGCGKTTLCKIILGLLEPTEGEILIGGIPIIKIGLKTYRELVGTVMQDDVLLTGSIMDNICFFDASLQQDKVEKCAKQASIHDEIVDMPMGYQTLLGDMGNSISGGQKQRILLARALYKQPKILVLDEATSHLDLGNEKKVNLELNKLQLTRIMIAHRAETIDSAERVVSLFEGKSTEVRGNHIVDRLKTSPDV